MRPAGGFLTNIQECIDSIVENWPEFSEQQLNSLSELLKPVRMTAQELPKSPGKTHSA